MRVSFYNKEKILQKFTFSYYQKSRYIINGLSIIIEALPKSPIVELPAHSVALRKGQKEIAVGRRGIRISPLSSCHAIYTNSLKKRICMK